MITLRSVGILLLLLGLAACGENMPVIAAHAHGPHDGVLGEFSSGNESSGYVEVKLHDDKGDLEVWLGEDRSFERPFDLPITASIEIAFLDAEKKITLRPRDTKNNPDEDGNPNIRDGKTNYFIFPGQAGEDASWLTGKDFKALVAVRFQGGEKSFQSVTLRLQPHSH